MVLSREPGYRLERSSGTENYGAQTPGEVRGAHMPQLSSPGPGERDSRMSSSSIGRSSAHLSRNIFRFAAALALAVFAFAALPTKAHAQSASGWDKRGQKAEDREDFDAAYEAYRQAHLKKPKDLRYKSHFERMRFQAANQHVDRGRVLRQSGDSAGAINEFSRALQIDPGNQAAAQELQQTDKPGPTAPGQPLPVLAPGSVEQTPRQAQIQREISSLGSPVQLQPVSNEPITLHVVEDVKNVYQAIGKAAGLNVLFDPDYTSKRIPVDLTSVSLFDALRIVGTLSGTFWKPVTSNTIFVAVNNRTKHTDLDDLAVQTFYLTNAASQNDANEILVMLRNILDPSIKVFLSTSQNAIVLRATQDQLILAEKLINDVDRTRPEVVIDVAVLEVSRQKERTLGITLPTSIGITPQASNYNQSSSSGSSSNSSNTSNTTTNGLTLNTLGNINGTNFAVQVTGGTVNALLSDSDTKILQNPRIRATDGQKATLKIGSKIPVATGSYNSGVSTGVANIGVQTQFTYLDVGVNIDMQPTVHYDREITLKMKIEVSSQSGNVNISGVSEPIIAQKVVDQTIQLHDGEPSILAGILQKQDSKSISGTPFLGEIPLLKYFFSSTDKTTSQDEVVFLIIPHIVREALFDDNNSRPIYTGTSNTVEVIQNPTPVVANTTPHDLNGMQPNITAQNSAANAASAMIGPLAAAGAPVQPPVSGAAPRVTPAGPGGPVSFSLVPGNSNQAVGSTFQVNVVASNANDLFAVPLQMHFDPRVLSLVNVSEGDFMTKDGQTFAMPTRIEANGNVTVNLQRPTGAKGVTGQGTVCTLTFKAVAAGDAAVAMLKVGAQDSTMKNLPAVGNQAVIHVK